MGLFETLWRLPAKLRENRAAAAAVEAAEDARSSRPGDPG
jgi:hypothetical protein